MLACEPTRGRPRFALVTFAHYYERKKEDKVDNDKAYKKKESDGSCDMQQKIIYISLTSKRTISIKRVSNTKCLYA